MAVGALLCTRITKAVWRIWKLILRGGNCEELVHQLVALQFLDLKVVIPMSLSYQQFLATSHHLILAAGRVFCYPLLLFHFASVFFLLAIFLLADPCLLLYPLSSSLYPVSPISSPLFPSPCPAHALVMSSFLHLYIMYLVRLLVWFCFCHVYFTRLLCL